MDETMYKMVNAFGHNAYHSRSYLLGLTRVIEDMTKTCDLEAAPAAQLYAASELITACVVLVSRAEKLMEEATDERQHG